MEGQTRRINDKFRVSTKLLLQKKEVKIKPISVKKYNENMSGVDRQDQNMSAYYPFERKTLRWYKKIGLHFMHLLLINSYFLYNKPVKKTSLYDYRLSVIQGLLPKQQNIQIKTKKRNSETHLPKKVPKNNKNGICTKSANIVMHREFERIESIFAMSVKTKLDYV